PRRLRHAHRRRPLRRGAAPLGLRGRRRNAGRLPDDGRLLVGPLAPGAGPQPTAAPRRLGRRPEPRPAPLGGPAGPALVVRAGPGARDGVPGRRVAGPGHVAPRRAVNSASSPSWAITSKSRSLWRTS